MVLFSIELNNSLYIFKGRIQVKVFQKGIWEK